MNSADYRRGAGLIGVLLGVLLGGFFWTDVYGQGPDYPTRTITLLVPYPAGGVTDLAARALGEAMEKHLKQPVVVVNKVGGGTTVAGYAVASAKPDGYTLGFFPSSTAIPEAFTYFQEAPYSSRDIRPISGVSSVIQSVAVRDDAPWNSLKELVEHAKKNPGLKVSTGGRQTVPHMFVTTLNKNEKTGFVGVPTAGDPQNLAGLLGGHVSVGIMDYAVMKPLVEAKKLRVLAIVTAEKRVDLAPTIPTAVELGYPVVYFPILGLFGPRGLPDTIVQKLDGLAGKITADQDFQTKTRNINLHLTYQNAATYERSLARFKESLLAFFKEEGLVKESK